MRTPSKKFAQAFVKKFRNISLRVFTAEQKILIAIQALLTETSMTECCKNKPLLNFNLY